MDFCYFREFFKEASALEAWIELGKILVRRRQYDDASEAFQKALSIDKDNLIKQKDLILKQRDENETNSMLKEEAMSVIRTIFNNPDRPLEYIELDRVKRIASNKTLNSEVLLNQMEREGIPVKDVPIIKEALKGYSTGKYVP